MAAVVSRSARCISSFYSESAWVRNHPTTLPHASTKIIFLTKCNEHWYLDFPGITNSNRCRCLRENALHMLWIHDRSHIDHHGCTIRNSVKIDSLDINILPRQCPLVGLQRDFVEHHLPVSVPRARWNTVVFVGIENQSGHSFFKKCISYGVSISPPATTMHGDDQRWFF